jgi:hypothetical protein
MQHTTVKTIIQQCMCIAAYEERRIAISRN